MKFKPLAVSTIFGLFLGVSPAIYGFVDPPPGCPPSVTGCAANYAKLGKQLFVCCDDLSDPTKCVNWFKQKWLCQGADGDPATYGWTLSSTTDTENLNCNTDNPGTCY